MGITKKIGKSLLLYILITSLLVTKNEITFTISALIGLLFMFKYYKDIKIDKVKPKIKTIFIYGLIIYGLTSFSNLISIEVNKLISLTGYSFTGENLSVFEFKNLYQTITMTIYAAIVAPIVEEFVFRGFILETLKGFNTKLAIIISAFIFGLFHMEYFQLLPAIISGILLGILYVKNKSIWVPVGAHMINNIISLILMYVNYDLTYIFIILSLLLLILEYKNLKIKDKKNNEFKYSYILKSLSCLTFIFISILIIFLSFKAI